MNLIKQKVIRTFKKPEYFYRPSQMIKRMRGLLSPKARNDVTISVLQQKMSVSRGETIGKSLVDFGVYDLALTETLWRLIGPGCKIADIGANIGYFSLVMAHRAGPYGSVHCFEPHPQLQKKWQAHLRKWNQCTLYPVALSSQEGEMDLYIPQNFEKNEGVASLEKQDNAKVIKVPVQTLDRALAGKKVELIKIDVEGHELEVFKGASKTLETVETIVFEDFQKSKSPVIDFLQNKGFKVFRLNKGFSQVSLLDVKDGDRLPLWEPPNYIATRDEDELRSKLASRGWKCLKAL